MSWKKHWRIVTDGSMSPISGKNTYQAPQYVGDQATAAFRNYQSLLPDVYVGHPNRVDRYMQYENMDLDSEVNSALDILAEFCTQKSEETKTNFEFEFLDKATDNEITILKEQLLSWHSLNEFDQRMFKIVRNTFKYGDQIFIRDPETYKWFWSEMNKISKVIVNESDGKRPEIYYIRDINPNFQNNTITKPPGPNDSYAFAPYMGGSRAYTAGGAMFSPSTRFGSGQNEFPVDAQHVVHLSMTEGLDVNWPFGVSILEAIFKTFKQKELIEDAMLIYRIQRAPERRVFKIDTGNLPPHLAMQFVERIKNEIHQRRIPSQSGGGQNLLDASYNPLCLDLTTKIPLLDGRTLTLSEIISEFESGKENWAYSCNPVTGKVVPGIINWAGITRKNTEVIELTFDNGKTLICTPDHKIPVFGKGFVEAQDLTENDSLISFNTQDKPISNGKTNNYQQVWDHEEKKWIWTHRMVGEFFRNLNKHQEFNYLTEYALKPRTVIHHKDADRFNNDPRNLVFMNKQDHVLYHASQKANFWKTMTPKYRETMLSKISSTLKDRWANMSESERLVGLWNIRAAQQKSIWLRTHNLDTKLRYQQNMSKSRRAYLANNPSALEKIKANCEHRIKIKNQPLNLTFDMLQIVADTVKSGVTNKNEVLKRCDNNKLLLALVKKHNSTPLDYKNAQHKIDFTKFGYSKMDKLLSKFGYKNWKHFVREINNFNHRIIKITKVPNRDTGTITIDGQHCWHDYHTFAIEAGIFVKNSINEDYFFPQGEGGRGSSVEILQGGQNLGEIDDLKYFTNKLYRGLRIPSSYLPTGPDESERAFTDGKVGTALIQEYRFNQYCMRLQKHLAHVFDQEFKLYLKYKGFNIDNSLFNLNFTEPQNFAAYKEVELDTQRINAFISIKDVDYISKRFMLKKYLQLSDLEIAENEKLWREERNKADLNQTSGSDLRNVGITPGAINTDLEKIGQLGTTLELPPGAEPPATVTGTEPVGGTLPGAPGTTAAATPGVAGVGGAPI